jgi:putative phosphoesterase
VAVSVLEELAAFAPVEAVCGNMDEPALRDAFPERRVVSVEGARIGLVHIPGPSGGREERLASWFPGCDAVVYGHTHVPQLERYRGVWIVNPGSPTERRRAPQHSMALLDVQGRTLQFRLTPLS